jgi:hypothetical protein
VLNIIVNIPPNNAYAVLGGMFMEIDKVQVKNNIIEDKMYYKKELVLSYKIEYPSFSSDPFQTNRLNHFYKMNALAFEQYCRQKLFRLAVKEYEYSVANGFPIRAYDAVLAYKITYNAHCTLSLYFDRYEYTGGAHGSTTRYSDTWDLQNNRRIPLRQLFSRSIHYVHYIIKSIITQIEQQIKSGNDIYFDDYENNVRKYFNPNKFYLTQQGVVIYFQQYEIAPYAAGIVEFTIPYSDPYVVKPSCN